MEVHRAYRDPGTDQIATGSVIQENDYDGQGRRTVQRIVNSADWNATYHYYYEGQSVVELRNGSDLVLKQHVWTGSFGAGYIDELVATSLNSDPIADDEADAHHFALHNANFNLMGLVDENGVLVERYEYGPYGRRQVYFSPGPNDPLAMAPTSQSRRWEVGGVEQPYGLNAIGHQGLMHDEVSGLVYNRARMLSPRLGRFVQRDSLGQNQPGGGYHDGMSLYQYVASNSSVRVDPYGTSVLDIHRLSGISVHSKREWKWSDKILKPDSRYNLPWTTTRISQESDFMVSLRTDYTVNINIAGPKGPRPLPGGPFPDGSGPLVTLHFSTQGFMVPRARIIGSAIRDGDALGGKLCRKTVYLHQKCCYDWKQGVPPTVENPYERDTYMQVHLFGETEHRGSPRYMPPVLRCDVSVAENELANRIDLLNSRQHNMCDERLDLSGDIHLDAASRTRSRISRNTVPYQEGSHNPVELFGDTQYLRR